MKATKFVVLLIFVGVVCTNVGARNLEEMSKETKLSISVPKTAIANGLGAELDSVNGATSAYNSEYTNTNAAAGPGGPSADASGSVYKSTYGSVSAEGPNASGTSYSTAYGSTGSNSAAGPNGAGGSGNAYGNAYSSADGSTGTTP